MNPGYNIALTGLTEREKAVADLWMDGRFRYADFHAGEVAGSGSVFHLSVDQLPQLSGWGMPFLTIGSRALDHPAGWQSLYDAGSAACWLLPAADPLIFPELNASSDKGTFLLPLEDNKLRRLFRQIAGFAGFDARTDFKNTEDLLIVMNRILEEDKPVHVFTDLDAENSDPVQFCYHISKLFSKNAGLKQKLHVWLMRDFARPGLDPVMIRNVIRPFAKRIFHPLEALLAMVESLFLHETSAHQRQYLSVPDFRSVLQMLYGQSVRIPDADPWAYLSALEWRLGAVKKALPFLWLFRLFSSQVGSGSVTLSPEPVINSGNSFD